MSKDYVAIADDVSAGAAALRSAKPDHMKGFAALGAPAHRSPMAARPCVSMIASRQQGLTFNDAQVAG